MNVGLTSHCYYPELSSNAWLSVSHDKDRDLRLFSQIWNVSSVKDEGPTIIGDPQYSSVLPRAGGRYTHFFFLQRLASCIRYAPCRRTCNLSTNRRQRPCVSFEISAVRSSI